MPRVATKLTPTAEGGWFARKRIPSDVQDAYHARHGQRWEERFNSGPMALTLARARHWTWLSEIAARIANIRAERDGREQMLTLTQARALAGEWWHWFTQRHLAKPEPASHWEGLSSDLRDELHDALRSTNDEWGLERGDPFAIWDDNSEARERARPMVADWAESAQFLHSKALGLDRTSLNLFLDYLCKDLFAALHLLKRRAEGDFSPDRYAERFPKLDRMATDPGLTPWMLFDGWVQARQPAASTVTRWRGVFVKLSADFPEHSAAALTQEEMQAWANGLINSERSARTVSGGWIGACQTVFEWALGQKLVAHNPFEDVKVTVPRKNRTRPKALTTDEIQMILGATLAIGALQTKTDAVRRWVPWLLAYTGARVGEITQLRAADVSNDDGISAINITPDAGSVKNREARTVPLHEHLIEQGFLEFVKASGKGPLFHNPATEPTEKGDPTKPRKPLSVKAREHLADWIRKKAGVTDKRIGPNHAWRHSFKLIGRRHGIDKDMLNWIVGHAPDSVGAEYGEPTLRDKADALDKFPRYATKGSSQ
jgi:integrase